MLRTNLATRPFYNERAVRIGIGVVVVIAAALTAFNVAQVLTLSDRNATFVTRAESAEARAAELRAQARATRDKLDKDDVSVVQAQAREPICSSSAAPSPGPTCSTALKKRCPPMSDWSRSRRRSTTTDA